MQAVVKRTHAGHGHGWLGNTPKLHQVFLDADLRYQLPGLKLLMEKEKIRYDLMDPGLLIVFVNRRRDFIKIIACNGTPNPILCLYRTEHVIHDLIPVIQFIPQAFKQNGTLDLNHALRLSLNKYFPKHGQKTETQDRQGASS